MADVNGTWLGTYWQQGNPTRFEVVLMQSGNSLTGNILDDGYLGEAKLSGEVIGRRISFTKRYFTSSPDAVEYIGTISEDEDYIQGQWKINRWDSGSWEARRSGEFLSLEIANKAEKKVPLTTRK
ncbi:hypothetical protein IQ247_27240 [Plectonema cf. radiosum LEGE 06105]|uniref:Uncharacterized protein n=1 Tax=Plectonema cf. radiosum LEGE 06105 TaxID=945769 RepID=A0A8J7F621_9CYAN|nr:hypothetical protein [Plectonema radiosum]MBE9216313.1 hypothetical protein [Plectonema cf. radiosum LEGE 06105]